MAEPTGPRLPTQRLQPDRLRTPAARRSYQGPPPILGQTTSRNPVGELARRLAESRPNLTTNPLGSVGPVNTAQGLPYTPTFPPTGGPGPGLAQQLMGRTTGVPNSAGAVDSLYAPSLTNMRLGPQNTGAGLPYMGGQVASPGAGAAGGALQGAGAGAAGSAAGSTSRFLNPTRPVTAPNAVPGVGGRQLVGQGWRSGAVRGLGYGLAGQAGGDLLDQLNVGGEGSTLDEALPGAARGAGMGAIFGPWGAAAGGALGAASTALDLPFLGGFFGGAPAAPEPPDSTQAFAALTSRLAPQQQQAITEHLALLAAQGIDDETARQSLLPTLQSLADQSLAEALQPTDVPGQLTPQEMLALQVMVSEVMGPVAQRQTASANAVGAMYDQLAGQQSDPGVSSATRAMGAAARLGGQSLADAYSAQAQLIPTMQQVQRNQAWQNQLLQQQLAQQASSSGGAGDLAALLQQQLTAG